MTTQRLQVDVIDGHRAWAATYDSDPNPVLALEVRVVSSLLGDLNGKRFVDIGTGTGRWLDEAARRGARVVGIDLCREMLTEARRKPAIEGRVAQSDLRYPALAHECADVVMCALSLGYISELRAAVAPLARLSRPAGRVVVSDIHPAALRRGWTRSFRAGDRSFEIRHHIHPVEEWQEAGRAAGLTLEHWLEPRFGDPEERIFRRAGKEELFLAARQVPALLIAIWRR